jgi:hypothetical protein
MTDGFSYPGAFDDEGDVAPTGGASIPGASQFGQIGAAASDIFGAIADFTSEGDYKKAADIAEQNVAITKEATGISEFQMTRRVNQAQGQTQADIAGAGLQNTGSAQYLMASGAYQGALAKQQVETQGEVQENTYQEQANAYNAQASAGFLGGIGKLLGAGLSIAGAVARI